MSDLDFMFGTGGIAAAAQSVWKEPAATLVKMLGLDRNIAPAVPDAIPLDGGTRARLVVEGMLDLYYVESGSGMRHHVYRVPAGGMMTDIGLVDARGTFIAVPSRGATLVETPLDTLLDGIRANPDILPHFETALTNWLAGLVIVAAPKDRPRALHIVEASNVAEIADPSLVHGGTLWFRAAAVRDTWGADAETDDRRLVPVPHGLWVEPAGDGPATVYRTVDWLAGGDTLAGLAGFLAAAVNRIVAQLKEDVESERRRVADIGPQRAEKLGSALTRLADVMFPGRLHQHISRATPLLAAAQTVWDAQDIVADIGNAAVARISEADDPVTAIAREAGVQVRKVTLVGERWWRHEHGPLLAFRGDRPCALISPRPGRYDIVDPESGTVEPVDARRAAELDDQVYAFTEPFPEEKLDGRKVFGFALRGARRDVMLIVCMSILTGILSLVTPIVTGWIVDPIIPDAELGRLYTITGLLIVAGFATVSFSLVQSLSSLRLEGNMANRIESAVWDRLLRVPVSFFRGYTVGDLANRAQGIDTMRALLTGTALTTLLHVVSILFSLGFMVFVSWRLAAVAAIGALIYAVIVFFVGRRILMHNRETMALTGRIQGIVLQLLNAVSKLRTAGAESAAFACWSVPYARLMTVTYAQQRLNMMLIVFKSGFHYFLIAAIVAVLAWQGGELWALFRTPQNWAQIDATHLHTILPTASFVSFNTAFGQFLGGVFGLALTLVSLTNLKPLYDRVEPILDAEIEDETGFEDPGDLTGEVEFANVRFRYGPDAPLVLDDLSFSVQSGSFVAVVGPSGAGKSTLIRLLLGFDEPEAGAIFFDGHDVTHLDKRLMRRQLGVVLQNGRPLAGSVFDNIAAGANVSRDDAMNAARLAGLEEDIKKLPMGLDTYLGEGASTLSGGQRQRMMIARAVVSRPKLLIFDEATSALDNETQALVAKGLEGLDATRIVIAHRLSTIVNADRIIVLSGGKVAEEGTYNELISLNGLFARLARRQIA